MEYHYKCTSGTCKLQDLPDDFFFGRMDLDIAMTSRLINYDKEDVVDMTSPLVWIVNHGMLENPEVLCPVCQGKAQIVIQLVKTSYTKGNGYLDRDGCVRDMNLYKLTKDDPYGHMREPGEKDHLVDTLKAKGKHQKNTQYFHSHSLKKS